MIFFCRAALRASRAPTTSAGWACEKVEMIRSTALEPSGLSAGVRGELQGDADLQVAAAGQVDRDGIERLDGARAWARPWPSPEPLKRKK